MRLTRSYRAIESVPFIKYIVNILSENLGAEERILLDMQTHSLLYFLLSHTNTLNNTAQAENQHKDTVVDDSRAITIENVLGFLHQKQYSMYW